ncbi:MAG: hypothetical protein WBW55_00240 [Desulfobaccales bacterium]
MKTEPFGTAQLAKIIGRNPRFVFDWVERGLIFADIKAAAGPGTQMEFSYAAVLRAYLALYFQTKYGFSRKKLKGLMESLWGSHFFHDWEQGFPEDRSINALFKGLEELQRGFPIEPQGGCLFIFNPYEDKSKVIFWSSSLAVALLLWEEESARKFFEGVHDVIALNLYDLKKVVDEQIAEL